MKLLTILLLSLGIISCSAKTPVENPDPSSATEELLAQEKSTENHAQIALSMYCFWTGEMKLGAIEGVVLTEAGWLGGHEVTLVTYDKTAINIKDLVTKATAIDCANKVYVPSSQIKSAQAATSKSINALSGYRKAKASDQKKQLQRTPYAKLNLTPSQATKVNAFCRVNHAKAKAYLTAEQISAL